MPEKSQKTKQSSQPRKGDRSKTEIQALESMLKKKISGAKGEHKRDKESE